MQTTSVCFAWIVSVFSSQHIQSTKLQVRLMKCSQTQLPVFSTPVTYILNLASSVSSSHAAYRYTVHHTALLSRTAAAIHHTMSMVIVS